MAYIDESGDSGIKGSQTYSLGCVLVRADAWPQAFDDLIAFRRWLRDTFGVPVRAEVKANFLLRNGGPFRALRLGEAARYSIYRQSMRLQAKLGFQTFAVVVNKARLHQRTPNRPPDDLAWEWLLNRLERFSHYGGGPILVVHDEGNARQIRASARKARRAGMAGSAYGTGVLRVPFGQLIDDPIPRDSSQSYFLQMADLAAYAAFRRLYPPPPRRVQIVPQGMWDELGAARLADANRLRGGPPGIVNAP